MNKNGQIAKILNNLLPFHLIQEMLKARLHSHPNQSTRLKINNCITHEPPCQSLHRPSLNNPAAKLFRLPMHVIPRAADQLTESVTVSFNSSCTKAMLNSHFNQLMNFIINKSIMNWLPCHSLDIPISKCIHRKEFPSLNDKFNPYGAQIIFLTSRLQL